MFRRAQNQLMGGGFLSGGGYGGWHGKHLEPVTEHERWDLDGSVTPKALDTPLTDRPATFRSGDTVGTGVFEFAHTRSTSYVYEPGRQTLADVRALTS